MAFQSMVSLGIMEYREGKRQGYRASEPDPSYKRNSEVKKRFRDEFRIKILKRYSHLKSHHSDSKVPVSNFHHRFFSYLHSWTLQLWFRTAFGLFKFSHVPGTVNPEMTTSIPYSTNPTQMTPVSDRLSLMFHSSTSIEP